MAHGRVSACIAKYIAIRKLSIHVSVTPFHQFMPCQYDIAAPIITLPLREHTRAQFTIKLGIAMLSFGVYLGGTLAPAEILGVEFGCPLPDSQCLEEEPLKNVLLKRQPLEQAAA